MGRHTRGPGLGRSEPLCAPGGRCEPQWGEDPGVRVDEEGEAGEQPLLRGRAGARGAGLGLGGVPERRESRSGSQLCVALPLGPPLPRCPSASAHGIPRSLGAGRGPGAWRMCLAALVAVLGQGIRPPWPLFPHLCSWDMSPAPHRMIFTLG